MQVVPSKQNDQCSVCSVSLLWTWHWKSNSQNDTGWRKKWIRGCFHKFWVNLFVVEVVHSGFNSGWAQSTLCVFTRQFSCSTFPSVQRNFWYRIHSRCQAAHWTGKALYRILHDTKHYKKLARYLPLTSNLCAQVIWWACHSKHII